MTTKMPAPVYTERLHSRRESLAPTCRESRREDSRWCVPHSLSRPCLRPERGWPTTGCRPLRASTHCLCRSSLWFARARHVSLHVRTSVGAVVAVPTCCHGSAAPEVSIECVDDQSAAHCRWRTGLSQCQSDPRTPSAVTPPSLAETLPRCLYQSVMKRWWVGVHVAETAPPQTRQHQRRHSRGWAVAAAVGSVHRLAA